MLLLKRHLVELVRAGKKRQTIRLWTRPIVRPGQISYTPGLGKMRIIAVEEVADFAALSEADAVEDGFVSRQALLAELRRIYGTRPPEGKRLFRIKFAWPVDADSSPGGVPTAGENGPGEKSMGRNGTGGKMAGKITPGKRGAAAKNARQMPAKRPGKMAAAGPTRGGNGVKKSHKMNPSQRQELKAFLLGQQAPGGMLGKAAGG